MSIALIAIIIMSAILITIGLINIISPKTGWWLQYGWAFKNAEPSDAALKMSRVSGVLMIIGLIILLFIFANNF